MFNHISDLNTSVYGPKTEKKKAASNEMTG